MFPQAGGLAGKYSIAIIPRRVYGVRLLEHAMYHCPDECYEWDDAYERGPKNFIALNDLNVSLHWVF